MQNPSWVIGTPCRLLWELLVEIEKFRIEAICPRKPYLGSRVSRGPDVSQDLQSYQPDSRVPTRCKEISLS